MADKEFLERILSMLPAKFQDVYDDTIPEAKEIRKKMGKKVSSIKSYSCAMPMFEDIRKLNYKGQAQVCKTFHQYLKKHPAVVSFFLDRFEETYSRINMKDLEESIEWIGYSVNDMDNTISEIDYNDPMTFFDIEKVMGKVISKELKCNILKQEQHVVDLSSVNRTNILTRMKDGDENYKSMNPYYDIERGGEGVCLAILYHENDNKKLFSKINMVISQ